MYVKCGRLKKAHAVFEDIHNRDVALWNTLIAGYITHELPNQALDSLAHMKIEGAIPNAITYTCALKACGMLGDLCCGEDLHNEIDKRGNLMEDSVLCSALVDMYAKCGLLKKAQKICEGLPKPILSAWNALISGYVWHNFCGEALDCFNKILSQNISPDPITYICTLKACSNTRALTRGQELHAHIEKMGMLQVDPIVGSTLVDMYVKCGSLMRAQAVFDELPTRTVVTWNSLISGYVDYEFGTNVLECLQVMQKDGVSPNAATYIHALKACSIIKSIEKGLVMHSEIARNQSLEKDQFVGSSLIDMYVKCGLLSKAQEALLELPVRNVATWNALIAGYTKHGFGHETFMCLEQMQEDGVSPDAITFMCCLKSCASIDAMDLGSEIHVEILRRGLLESDSLLGSSLVSMYASFGALSKAQEVFDGIPIANLDIWNALISGYVEHECGEKALYFIDEMKRKDVSPNTFTLICALKASSIMCDTCSCTIIHAEVERKGFMEENGIGCALVDIYVKCGLLEKARDVFNEILIHSTELWNACIAGYDGHVHAERVFECLHRMQLECAFADAITYLYILKACGNSGALEKGCQVHTEIVSIFSLQADALVANALLDMYACCGAIEEAQKVFENLPQRDLVSWNSMIGSYIKIDECEEALLCFESMQHAGVSPDAITFTCALKACVMIGEFSMAVDIHAEVERQGLLESDLILGNAVIDMYCKSCFPTRAKDVLKRLPRRDIFSWNGLLAGYTQDKYVNECLDCFEQMQCDGIFPDAVTFACCLKACGATQAVEKGRNMHALIEQFGWIEKDDIVGNAVIDMYAKCGYLSEAEHMFDNLLTKSTVSWNALISGYVTHFHGEDALECFEEMQNEGYIPNSVTLLCSLKACSMLSACDKGKMIHAEVERQGLLEFVGNMLVDMYGKCGLLESAHSVFERLECLDIVSCNAFIGGYAQQGEAGFVFQTLSWMIEEGLKPDLISLGNVLTACCHAGLVDEAYICFDAIVEVYGIIPATSHFTCMVDILGRAGQEDTATTLATVVPVQPDITMLSALLAACKKWSNIQLGLQIFDHLLGLDDKESSLYVCMYNIYANADIYEH
ncbi:hypothetical protein KP509_12G090300 [Ceratopteris richardii]|nr:hypothetical protein KP509_12G090300 [Ceratopteris richardii]